MATGGPKLATLSFASRTLQATSGEKAMCRATYTSGFPLSKVSAAERLAAAGFSSRMAACGKCALTFWHTVACVGVGVAMTTMSGSYRRAASMRSAWTGTCFPRKGSVGGRSGPVSTPASTARLGTCSRALICDWPAMLVRLLSMCAATLTSNPQLVSLVVYKTVQPCQGPRNFQFRLCSKINSNLVGQWRSDVVVRFFMWRVAPP